MQIQSGSDTGYADTGSSSDTGSTGPDVGALEDEGEDQEGCEGCSATQSRTNKSVWAALAGLGLFFRKRRQES